MDLFVYFQIPMMINKKCDTPKPGGPLTTRQPVEYKWMSGYLTPLQKNRAESPLYGELYPNTIHV